MSTSAQGSVAGGRVRRYADRAWPHPLCFHPGYGRPKATVHRVEFEQSALVSAAVRLIATTCIFIVATLKSMRASVHDRCDKTLYCQFGLPLGTSSECDTRNMAFYDKSVAVRGILRQGEVKGGQRQRRYQRQNAAINR